MSHAYFAACTLGIEAALEGELRALGATDLEVVPGGVRFGGRRRVAYKACLWLRSAIRVQETLAELGAGSREELYEGVRRVDWRQYMRVDQTLAVDGSVTEAPDDGLRHSKYAALVVKDAIVDQFRDRSGRRPDVDTERPSLPLKLVVNGRHGTLYRNLSGSSLHKRGWRPIQVKSPLNEATAAGLLLLTGWDRQSPLVDPMCGSGTFVIEAALLAADRAPGLGRRFPLELWPDFEEGVWRSLIEEAQQAARRSLPFAIEGADRHGGALELARRGAHAAQVDALVRFTHAELRRFEPRVTPRLVVTNPPYGIRLGDGEDLERSWSDLGGFLHERCRGATAWILCGNPELTRLLGLRTSQKLPVRNGPIDCRFLRYDIHAEERAAAPPAASDEPSPWIARHAHLVRPGGSVLDVACGGGRHSRLFLDRGHPVVAIDRDTSGLGALAERAGLEVITADLESGPWPTADRRFDAIVVCNYLWRPLLPRLGAALAPGGVLLYDTFAVGQERLGKPTNPDYLLRPNELFEAFAPALTVLAYEHGETREPTPAIRQRLCARREQEA